jgi:hypothetical protein
MIVFNINSKLQIILFQKRHVQTCRALATGHAQWMTVHLHVLALTDIMVHAVKVNI